MGAVHTSVSTFDSTRFCQNHDFLPLSFVITSSIIFDETKVEGR